MRNTGTPTDRTCSTNSALAARESDSTSGLQSTIDSGPTLAAKSVLLSTPAGKL